MKRLIYTLLWMALGLFSAQAQNSSIFDQFSNEKNVTYVNISKALLNMMPAGQLEVDALDLKSVINDLDRIQILTCEEDANLIKRIRKASSAYFKKAPYEELMQVKDDEESVVIYIYPKPQKKIKELVMLVDDGSEEFVLIQLTGDISISQAPESDQKHTITNSTRFSHTNEAATGHSSPIAASLFLESYLSAQ